MASSQADTSGPIDPPAVGTTLQGDRNADGVKPRKNSIAMRIRSKLSKLKGMAKKRKNKNKSLNASNGNHVEPPVFVTEPINGNTTATTATNVDGHRSATPLNGNSSQATTPHTPPTTTTGTRIPI